MSRQEDSDDEVKHGLAFGLSSIVNHQLVHKKAHSVFKYIDDASATEGTADFARAIIGIDSWDQLIPKFTVSREDKELKIKKDCRKPIKLS